MSEKYTEPSGACVGPSVKNPSSNRRSSLAPGATMDGSCAGSTLGAKTMSIPTTRIQRRNEKWHFRQADGTILERWTGGVFVYVVGKRAADEVVFGGAGDLVLVGSRTLEGLNFRVEPDTKRLVDAGPAPAAAAA